MTTLNSTLAVFGLGPTELVVILVILLVLFGGSKLPSLAKGLGQSIKEFKKASHEVEAAVDEAVKPAEPKKVEPAKVEPPKAPDGN
jgi:sec-independent protein translocase protein TatA